MSSFWMLLFRAPIVACAVVMLALFPAHDRLAAQPVPAAAAEPRKAPPPSVNGNIILPVPEAPFRGRIGVTPEDSQPSYPSRVQAPKGAPNVLVIMTDDVGFGASSTFGGPIPTVAFDRLAKNGLRYNAFHVTALCSPTRAALLTGRNHHTNGTGVVTDMAEGFPGYNSIIPKSSGTIAEVLKQNGYSTAMFGKHHNLPHWEMSASGPFDRWPTGLGFEYFYGVIEGAADQWSPPVFEGTTPVEPYRGKPDYHFDKDLADHAIRWIRDQHGATPGKPILLYYSTLTAHNPHHAPKEWIARFRDRFDQGWDKTREETFERQKRLGIIPPNAKLTPRPEGIPAWDSRTPDQKRIYSRMMEVYAASLSHADHQIGRVLDALQETGQLDNTLVFYIQGDNGASLEGTLQGRIYTRGEDEAYLLSMIDEMGGSRTWGHYPVGWAWAMNSPFQWGKQVASHLGGTRNGMVISWPKRIQETGSVRPQFTHVVDLAPTIMEAAGISAPSMLNGVPQKPIDGTSMVYSFASATAPTRHSTQYFEMVGNRALYHQGWMASTTPGRAPWIIEGGTKDGPESYKWELYHLDKDFSQAGDLAVQHSDKLRQLHDMWWGEAARHNVLPLNDRLAERLNAPGPHPDRPRTSYTYYPGQIRIHHRAAADVKNRSYVIEADIDIDKGPASGILLTQGGRFAGWGLMLIDNKPVFAHKLSNQSKDQYLIRSGAALAPGRHRVRFEFQYDGGGSGKGGLGILSVDGREAARGRLERTLGGSRVGFEDTLDVGEDTGTPLIEEYADKMPFRFTGLRKVNVTLQPASR